MIKLKKLSKPKILIDKGDEWTTQYIQYKQGNDAISKSIENKYSHTEIKQQLIKETNGKCAYCESKILHVTFGDIEHIIPKNEVWEKCFEWGNLTLACSQCNNKKRAYYNEISPLINPYTDNPSEHIFFCGPMLVPKSTKGKLTESKLKLNRPELFENRSRFLQKLLPFVERLQNTSETALIEVLLEDLIAYSDVSEEYSAMTSSFICNLKKELELPQIS